MGEIKVPQLGESVVEATVARWVKQPGEPVAVGDALLELETEKVNVEVAAEEAGTLEKVLHEAGATVKVGEVVGVIGNGAASVPAPAPATAPAVAPEEEPNVTPVARRLAEEHAIDPASLQGSGPGGRVTKEDVLSKIQPAGQAPAAAPDSAAGGAAPPRPPATSSGPSLATLAQAPEPREERVPLSRRRQNIARRLVEAQHTAAMLTTFNEVDMSSIMDLRSRRRDSFREK